MNWIVCLLLTVDRHWNLLVLTGIVVVISIIGFIVIRRVTRQRPGELFDLRMKTSFVIIYYYY